MGERPTANLIIGGGLIGLATARALLDAGQPVVVLEAREGVGLETSFANGGMLTPSLPEPWNSPGVGRQLFKALFDPRAPVRFQPGALPSLLGWGLRFLRHSGARSYIASSMANYRLCRYSVDQTLELTERRGLDYELSKHGTLCVFDSHEELEDRWRLCEVLAGVGMTAKKVDCSQIAEYEPALAPVAERYAGGILLPDEARGDAHLFCRALADSITVDGGEIRTNSPVSAIAVRKGKVSGVQTGTTFVPAERVILAAGPHSPGLLAPFGIACRVKPARGYSITFDSGSADDLPLRSILDESAHAVVGAYGSRLRIVGFAEFAGFDASIPEVRIDELRRILGKVLPGIGIPADADSVSAWAGLRPMSCDGRPIIGPTRVRGLYLNTGHGALGWTMAVGSGLLLADLIADRRPAIDPAPFLPAAGR